LYVTNIGTYNILLPVPEQGHHDAVAGDVGMALAARRMPHEAASTHVHRCCWPDGRAGAGGCTAQRTATQAAGSGAAGADAAAAGNGNVDIGSSLGGRPAPNFTLVNQFGQPMSLSQFRGKVVLLSFDAPTAETWAPVSRHDWRRRTPRLWPAFIC
jgi:AhpC/TSA family